MPTDNPTPSRPRMAAIYMPGTARYGTVRHGTARYGTVRARRWRGDGDVRGYRPP